MLPFKGIIFLLLNAIRTISIVSLLLIFAAVISLMAQDSKAYFALKQSTDFQSYSTEYCYFPETEVPTSTWGLFWLQLDRFNILIIAIICIISECTIPVLSKLYDRFLPILGSTFSTAPLGITQMMTSASLLSHYQEGFVLRVAWLLFFVGVINFLLGIAFRSEIRLRRSLIRSKREQFNNKGNTDIAEKSGNTSAGSYLQPAMTPSILTNSRRPSSAHSIIGQPVEPIKTPLDAFAMHVGHPASIRSVSIHNRQRSGSNASSRASVFMRERAREENMRVELADDYRWNEKKEVLKSPAPSISDQISELQHRVEHGNQGVLKQPGEGSGIKAAFQRRSLVLSRVVKQVKRASSTKQRRPKSKIMPMPLPIRYATSNKPSEWVEVDRSPDVPNMPPISYQPSRGTVYEDLHSTRTRYHTPIADRFI